MRVSVLASGSNGNATCIKTTNESFLIDDGLSFKMLYVRMEETNNDIHNLSSIFITHEHIDHVSGLKVLLKRKQLNEAERMIIDYFTDRFPIEHGNEYFRTKKHNWEMIKVMFLEEMVRFLTEKGWGYEIHEGWVAPNTY